MNKVILMGRLTRDPEVRYSSGSNSMCVAKYSLAVDRKYQRDGEPTADFIPCVAFSKQAEFAEKYGVKVYTTDVIVEDQEFVESKAAEDRRMNNGNSNAKNSGYAGSPAPDGFMNIPEGIDEELPFN